MLIVLMLWVSYLNVTVVGVPPSLLQEKKITEISEATKIIDAHSPLANFKRNASLIYENLKARILGITNKNNEINIEK